MQKKFVFCLVFILCFSNIFIYLFVLSCLGSDGWSGDEMDMFSRNAPPPPGGGMGPPRGVGGYGGRAGVGGGSGYRVPPPPPPNGMLMGDSNMGPGSSMLAPKTSTQVTIPKEVSPSDLQPLKSSFKIPKTVSL